ncbi:uncharacterized protein LOC119085826 isoform X1 [Bradysia coprophila]|uniref:uncharacterized protein LOC119085826 isoform X1 n=2 Tax=Bradysia coprophila TaxID=38358 RepID=UPI00187D8F7A|nr:uncharacterized protein LOC119085826 isoform X1 [Bradysia coprophila]
MLEQIISLTQNLTTADVDNFKSEIDKFLLNMWPRNDGTFVTPHGQQVPQQIAKQPGAIPSSSDVARVKNGDNSNVNPSNGAFDPDDEIDYSDSEFDEDCSEFDEDDSELENEAILASHLMQMQHQANMYAPNALANVSSAAHDASHYSALNALSQLSTSVAPNYGMQGQNVDPANHSAVIAALSQLSGAPAYMQNQQKVKDPNQNAANAMGQMGVSMAHWQQAQAQAQAQQAMHAAYMQQSQAYAANGHKSGDQNCNNNKDDSRSDIKKEVVKAIPNNVRNSTSTPNRMSSSKGGGTIRPRVPPYRCRNETGVDLFQLRRREFEETFTTEDDSASSSPIKDLTAKLKHLKILKLFRRNKTSRENLVTISSINPDLPSLRDAGNCIETNQDEGKSQLQKISEVLLKPSEKGSIWTNTEHDTDNQNNMIVNRSSSYEKSIQAFLFRSNFPEHFLAIRLLQLSIEDVQQLIRQIDLLENVQDKLTETVRTESLSGPALMSCDLNELKKSLDLNLGHWTIFEQLITGLRNIQYDEFLKLNIEKQIKISQEFHDNALDGPNSRCSSLSSESQTQPIADARKKDINEDVKASLGVKSQNGSQTVLH